MSALLEVRDLSVQAGAKRLVQGISLSVAAGERLGLVGESGSGKSLTALAITGLLPPGLTASGSVRLAGHEFVGAPDRTLVPLRGAVAATVFQDPRSALDPLMRLGHQLAIPIRRRLHRQGAAAPDRIVAAEQHEWLDRVGLGDAARILRSWPHEVSGGQRQRLAIAMALACKPRLLIADEPTTALDITTQAGVLRLLDDLVRDEGLALIFISHDLPVVAGISDRVMVMHSGRVVEEGPTAQVLTRPRAPYTQTLVDAARRLQAAVEGGA